MVRYIAFGKESPGDNIVEIVYKSCKGGNLYCKLLQEDMDGDWWAICADELPTRYLRITGEKALKRFIQKYGYMDKNDCVNYKDIKLGIDTANRVKQHKVISGIQNFYVNGIPQRSANSGNCWFSAMCFAMFFCKEMRDVVKYYSKDSKLNQLIDVCLQRQAMGEELRQYLYFNYAIGDNPKQNPELDGQNGLTEFVVLCAKLGIPIVRLFAPNLSNFDQDATDKKRKSFKVTTPDHNTKGPSLLCVRCFRTKWRPRLRMKHNGITYKLMSVMIGSEHCGHQIGASTCDGKICRWAVADSDACREGIGPIIWKCKRRQKEHIQEFVQRWWELWGKMIPVTLFNSNSFCDFSPLNRSTCTLENKAKGNKPNCNDANAGVVNSDFIYISYKS